MDEALHIQDMWHFMFNYVIDFFYYYFILWWLWSSWHWNGSLLHKRLRRKAADQILQCYVFPMFFNSIDHLDIHSALVPACDSFIAYFWEAFVTLDRDYADEAATRILEWFKTGRCKQRVEMAYMLTGCASPSPLSLRAADEGAASPQFRACFTANAAL